MPGFLDLAQYRVVRLNATISPVYPFEMELFHQYSLDPVQVEADSPQDLIEHTAGSHAILVVSSSLPAQVIESLERCQIISRLGIGTEKIDVKAATRKGILVTNVPGCFSEEMADHTMAFILGLARKLPQMSKAIQQGAWRRSRWLSIHNQRLSGCVLGLVGFGDSAQRVVPRAQAFGMHVIATRRNIQAPDRAARELGVEMVSFDALLSRSDFVSLHLPLNPETYHLLDEAALRKMKPGACLINTARGAIVDELALAAVLKEGWLGGAGLDTFEHINPFAAEEAPPAHPLLELDNVLLTPHVAALSVQGMEEVTRGGIENVVSVLQGHWPRRENIVNPGVVPRLPLAERSSNPAIS